VVSPADGRAATGGGDGMLRELGALPWIMSLTTSLVTSL
jgi:hypothetical protein